MPVGGHPLPLGDDDVALHLARHAFSSEQPRQIAVAVSGGSDSLAALHLMADTAGPGGWQVRAVTVDHALRPEAAAEARAVAAICARLGVAHDTLHWDHGVVPGNLPDAARRARYGLMADWARKAGVSHIVLGHTADDQAETFLMGLGRAAGLDGLSGMRPHWDQGGVRFVRPFLALGRAQLRGLLERRGVAWIDDPTNADDRYTRVKARRAMAALAPLGITADRLSTVIGNLQAVQVALDAATRRAAVALIREVAGEVIFDRALWASEPPEVQRRLLVAALRAVSGAPYAPRAAAVARLIAAITAGRDATLWGCRIKASGDRFCVLREPRAVAGLIAAPGGLWDGRWRVTGPFPDGADVRALGQAGLRVGKDGLVSKDGLSGKNGFSGKNGGACKDWRATGASRDALIVSPAVWLADRLIAAPLAGFDAGFAVRIEAPCNLFALSH